MWSDYGWKNAVAPCSCGYIAPAIAQILEPLGRRVLDVGCGNGALCGLLKDHGYSIVGLEYDAKGYDVSRTSYPHIRFYNCGVEDNPALIVQEEGLFDVVVSTEVIEHLFSPHFLPQYACGALKAEGFLVVTTPYHGYLKNFLLSLFNKWDSHHTPLWQGGHIKFWSRKTLTQLLESNGFRVVGFKGVGRLPFLWKSMILIAQKKPA